MLRNVFMNKQDWSVPFDAEDYSIEHVLAKQMLAIHFQEHVMD